MPRFERAPYGYGYPMSQQGAGGLAMVNQGNTPGFPLHRYLNQRRQMYVMVPKGEPKVEPVADLAGGAAAYHQMMNWYQL